MFSLHNIIADQWTSNDHDLNLQAISIIYIDFVYNPNGELIDPLNKRNLKVFKFSTVI